MPSGTGAAQKQDDAIMGTNNSSIVSKRSVERLYLPEPHFFRYFVKKPQRRSPLINRGYWLRMEAIDFVVRQFLRQNEDSSKVVVNLGCGYDPLPWQCLSKYPDLCIDTQFIDIDYAELMRKKRDVVSRTPVLKEAFTKVDFPDDGDILLRSDQYLQIGCDLRDLERLENILSSTINFQGSHVLLVAEVSITYMSARHSDALIKWASSLPRARFCLLEQLLPQGTTHPFAQTMMAHFQKLKTPLQSVEKYPTITSQQARFQALGWKEIEATNLWSFFGFQGFLLPQERRALDFIEPFDEWEEFALFGCHYILLVADNKVSPSAVPRPSQVLSSTESSPSPISRFEVRYHQHSKGIGCRRFGAVLPLGNHNSAPTRVGLFAGMGLKTRMDSCDVFEMTTGHTQDVQSLGAWSSPSFPSSRMCHTITDLGDAGALLVGGRTSPDNALVDCWIYHKWVCIWERVDDLPYPIYRHCAAAINGNVLVSTGRVNSKEISPDYLIWNRGSGWRKCDVRGDIPPHTFGASIAVLDAGAVSNCVRSARGTLAGGISMAATIEQGIWQWEFNNNISMPSLTFQRSFTPDDSGLQQISRFGASIVYLEGKNYICGGIIKDDLLSYSDEFYPLDVQDLFRGALVLPSTDCSSMPRPLLIGSTVFHIEDQLIIISGGAVCFSFGTYWNQGCYTISESSRSPKLCKFVQKMHWQAPIPNMLEQSKSPECEINKIRRVKITSQEEFAQIVRKAMPVVLEGLDFGQCRTKWTSTYLKEMVGPERLVSVHQSKASKLDFVTKNFQYVTMTFGEFIDSINRNEMCYLRSLSSCDPTQYPSDIHKDFPTIAEDFQLPLELEYAVSNSHSAPLRISGPVSMWLHYDVMANIYCQVYGQRRFVVFPPEDVLHLGFEMGSSSSSLDVFSGLQDPCFANTHPHEAILAPGDILFLPPCWLHAASPLSSPSIAVNVFFRDLKSGYGLGKDIYGNRDLQPYEKGRQDIAKLIKAFEKIPCSVRNFYLQRLVAEFQQMASVN